MRGRPRARTRSLVPGIGADGLAPMVRSGGMGLGRDVGSYGCGRAGGDVKVFDGTLSWFATIALRSLMTVCCWCNCQGIKS